MSESKSIIDWLRTLPEPYQALAVDNSNMNAAFMEEMSRQSLHSALSSAFVWGATPQGFEFWWQVSEGRQPPVPVAEDLQPHGDTPAVASEGVQKSINVLLAVEHVFHMLAKEAGDVAFWNEGGDGREATIKVREHRKELERSL